MTLTKQQRNHAVKICPICTKPILPGESKSLLFPAGTPGNSDWLYRHSRCLSKQRRERREAMFKMTTEELTADLLGLK